MTFDQRYYALNKMLLSSVGMWPFQATCLRRSLNVCASVLYISLCVPMYAKMFEIWGDVDSVLECLPSLLVLNISTTKYYGSLVHLNKMKLLLVNIKEDWKNFVQIKEIEIFQKYAEDGRKLTLFYLRFMYTVMTSFLTLPMAPLILDVILPLNETRKKKYLFEANYFVDEDEYFYEIFIHGLLLSVLIVTILVASDTIYMMYVYHVCAIFKIISYQLEHIDTNAAMNLESRSMFLNSYCRYLYSIEEKKIIQQLVQCIKKHNRAIRYAESLEESYTISLFMQLLMNVICISVTGIQTIMKLGILEDMFRFGLYTIAQVFHIFFLTFPSQLLTDHCDEVFVCAYNAQWYNFPKKPKTIFQFLFFRSIKVCRLTAGKICILSKENFISLIKTAMSYFTVLSSLR